MRHADRLYDVTNRRDDFDGFDEGWNLDSVVQIRRDSFNHRREFEAAWIPGCGNYVCRDGRKAIKYNVRGKRSYIVPTSDQRECHGNNGYFSSWSHGNNVTFFVDGRFCKINTRSRDNVGCFL